MALEPSGSSFQRANTQERQEPSDLEDRIILKLQDVTHSLGMSKKGTHEQRHESIKKAIEHFNTASDLYDELKYYSSKVSDIDWSKIRLDIEKQAGLVSGIAKGVTEPTCSNLSLNDKSTYRLCEPANWKPNRLFEVAKLK